MSNDYDPNYEAKMQYFVVGGKALIFNAEKQILLLQRSDKVGGSGSWSFPGGAVDPGEDAIDGLIREIDEETGLEVKDIKPYAVTTHVHGEEDSVIIIGYLAQLLDGEVKLNWEHDNYKWLDMEQIFDYDLTPDAEFFITEYKKFIKEVEKLQ